MINQSPVATSDESEQKKPECPICNDKGLVIYRVHYKTEWVEDPKFKTLVPTKMVPETDFLAGKVCTPKDAKEWKDTYSRECECVKTKRIERIMKASEITDDFKKMGFKNFMREGKPKVIHDAFECAMEYFQEFNTILHKRQNSIALLGQPGAGKTHLLMAIANNLIKKLQVPVLYFPYVEGFGDLKDDFDLLEEKLERMKKVDVLFIDDLFKPVKGKPRATEWQVEQTYAVVNYRYLNHKPILVSSELTIEELIEVDEALGTRIFQMCQDYTVVIPKDIKLNHRLEGLNHV
nr:DnaA/Hda family protein [Bacillus methanolicus]